MKRKFLEDLGLEKEIIDKIMTENGSDIETAKADYESLKQQLEAQSRQITERDRQLEELKKSSGDSEILTQQIATLQEENKAAREKYEADMKELKLTTAVKLAVGGTAHDADLVTSLLDKAKLILSDDGKVAGLDEQLKTLKAEKSFLFKSENAGTEGKTGAGGEGGGYKPKAGKTNDDGYGKGIAEAMNQANAAADNPYAKAWE